MNQIKYIPAFKISRQYLCSEFFNNKQKQKNRTQHE